MADAAARACSVIPAEESEEGPQSCPIPSQNGLRRNPGFDPAGVW